MTAISPMINIHEDICTSAERERASIIILPFHKQQRFDGALEVTRNYHRWVNQRVLEHAPCSVGILVDRGLGGSTHVSARNVCSTVTVLFFGGGDDREALAYGVRMAEHPGISLTVIHFIASLETAQEAVSLKIDICENSSTSEGSGDEKFLVEFKQKFVKDSSIKFEERVVRNAAETIEVILEYSRCDLFLVGRMPEVATLIEKSDCIELGPVGSLLTSPDFSTSASVLVVQQFISKDGVELEKTLSKKIGSSL
ncbi:cation/h(+) antiporter 18 [Quercus suber]|uniref:Cation/h(+) antiporter 18 n=1 Tax=Quercus suber TaxID=58331 RepID=A0AAW0K5I1_QUESU